MGLPFLPILFSFFGVVLSQDAQAINRHRETRVIHPEDKPHFMLSTQAKFIAEHSTLRPDINETFPLNGRYMFKAVDEDQPNDEQAAEEVPCETIAD